MCREKEGLEELAGLAPGDRESGLLLDRHGRWLHEGEPVEHARLSLALHRWVDRDSETGRYLLRAGPEWCFVEVEDTPCFVRGIVLDSAGGERRVTLRLADGTEEELDYATLRQSADNVLYCDVRAGTMSARFDRNAYYRLAELVELDGDRPVLPAAGSLWPIAFVD